MRYYLDVLHASRFKEHYLTRRYNGRPKLCTLSYRHLTVILQISNGVFNIICFAGVLHIYVLA